MPRHANLYSRDKRAAKQMAILVTCFAICWLPYTVVALVTSLYPNTIPEVVFEITFWLLWLNSAINPFLYSFVNDSFRYIRKR